MFVLEITDVDDADYDDLYCGVELEFVCVTMFFAGYNNVKGISEIADTLGVFFSSYSSSFLYELSRLYNSIATGCVCVSFGFILTFR